MDQTSEVIRDDVRAALFRKGIIAPWYLFDYQFSLYNLFINTKRDIVIPNISRRFGKSSVCVVYAIEQAIRKKQKVRYGTAFLSDLEEFLEPIFESVLEFCPDDMAPKWTASKKTWKFRNGSIIKFVGLDLKPNGMRGNDIDIAIIDEAAFVKKLKYIYMSAIVPATMLRPFKIILPSTPPESPEHFWSKELIPKAKIRGTYLELNIDDNTRLDDFEKNRLFDEVGGKHSPTAQREFYCKIIVDATRAIAPDFDESRHVGTVNHEHVRWTYAGDSGGVKDKTVILKVGYCHIARKTLIAAELTFDPHTATPVIAEKFKMWSGSNDLVLDAHGQTRVDIASLGIKASMPQKDDFEAGLQLLNAMLYNDEILIDRSCALLITTLNSGLLTVNKKDYERSDSLGHCDAVAACIYALRAVDKVTDLRPKPKKSSIFVLKPEFNPILEAFT